MIRLRYSIIPAILLLAACTIDDSTDIPMVELGTATKDFTVDATAGHLDIDVLSNRRYNLQFLEETSWAGLSVLSLQGDSSFGIDYDDNPGFPRMTRVLLETDNKLHRDTVILRQRGELTPELTLSSNSLVVAGSRSGSGSIRLDTNIDFDILERSIVYTQEEEEWITGVSYSDGMLQIAYDGNPDDEHPRTASVVMKWADAWGEPYSATLNVLQQNAKDQLGRNVDFEYIRNMVGADEEFVIDEYVIISGYVVSDINSGNVGENIKTTETTIDYTGCQKTVYLESLDGKYGFMLETKNVEDNIFKRYDKVQLLLKDAVVSCYDEPLRYLLTEVKSQMIVDQARGTAADIPSKKRYINELSDDDMYTFVELRDCEFPIRKGSLTPLQDGYTLSNNNHYMSKYPRLMRDIDGSVIYLYTNSTCPYRRDGKMLPYGSGEIGGVVVFERYPAYIYGDGDDEDTHGNIGRYQLRHMAYEDIRFDASESFSNILTEYRLRWDSSHKAQSSNTSDGREYWYPTLGTNGWFSHSQPTTAKTYTSAENQTTWNFLGPCGTGNGLYPFAEEHIGDPNNNGTGIILEDGTKFPAANKLNSDGKGIDEGSGRSAWKKTNWWDYDSDKPHSWVIEFSTAGIDADILAMQFSTQGGKASFGVSPIYWKAEWSLTGDLNNDDDWKFIDSYYVPDMMITSTVRPWQIGAYKQIDIRLPLEMLGHDEVYIRLSPERNVTNSNLMFAGSTIPAGNKSSNTMDYFAIRYNKRRN